MEGELYGKWNAIGANGIRANGKSGVPLTIVLSPSNLTIQNVIDEIGIHAVSGTCSDMHSDMV